MTLLELQALVEKSRNPAPGERAHLGAMNDIPPDAPVRAWLRLAVQEPLLLVTYVARPDGLAEFHRLFGALPRGSRVVASKVYPGAWTMLRDAGVELRYVKGVHAKAVIPEAGFVLVSSWNLTRRSMTTNAETTALLDGPDADGVRSSAQHLWERAVPYTWERSCALKDDWEGSEDLHRDEFPLDRERIIPSRIDTAAHEHQKVLIAQILTAHVEDPLPADGPPPGRRTRKTGEGWIVKLPTGAGKTVVAADVLVKMLERSPGLRVLWVAPRHALLEAAAMRLQAQLPGEFMSPKGIWLQSPDASRWSEPDPSQHRFVFCTNHRAETLLRGDSAAPFEVVIVDECHHYRHCASTYKSIERWRLEHRARLIGLSATPRRGEESTGRPGPNAFLERGSRSAA